MPHARFSSSSPRPDGALARAVRRAAGAAPGFTDEGLRAAIEARRRQPGLGVLILSQYVEPVYTSEPLASGEGGVGYMLKERVGDVRGFVDAVGRVAAGGTALDREVVAELVRSRDAGGEALAELAPREREVLELTAEGRTNAAIARAVVVQPGAVEKHITSSFGKLGLPATDDDHRRVLAVLAFSRRGSAGRVRTGGARTAGQRRTPPETSSVCSVHGDMRRQRRTGPSPNAACSVDVRPARRAATRPTSQCRRSPDPPRARM